ncbi:MAG: FkbM family methyltransferase [Terriglobia bacterium]
MGLTRWTKSALVRGHRVIAPFMSDRYAPYRFEGGRIYLNVKESPMMLARALGLFEIEETKAITSLLKPGMTFVDVGGNKGDFSLLAARAVGTAGRVLCFEPETQNVHWIRKSVELNGYHNVTVFEMALGDRDEEAQLYLGAKSGWHSLLSSQPHGSGQAVKVKKRTLDSVLAEIGQRVADVIKIDVEGAELEVLRGAEGTLRANPQITVIMDIHAALFGVDPFEISGFLKGFGFSMYEVAPPPYRRLEVGKNSDKVLACRS